MNSISESKINKNNSYNYSNDSNDNNVEINWVNTILCEKINKEYEEIKTLTLLEKKKREELEFFKNKLNILYYLAKIILFISCFMVMPNWCALMGNDISKQCRTGIYDTDYYRSFIYFLPTFYIDLVYKIMMLIILLYYYYIKNIFKDINNDYTYKLNMRVKILLYLFISHIVSYYLEKDKIIENFKLTEIIKVVFLIISSNLLFALFYKIYTIIKASVRIIICFLIGHFLIAYLAKVLFQGYEKFNDLNNLYTYNFDTFVNSFITIFTFFSFNNSPNIITKVAQYNYIIIPFFVCVSIFNLILFAYFISWIYLKQKQLMIDNINKCYKNTEKRKIFNYCLEKNYLKINNKAIRKIITCYIEKRILVDLENLKFNTNDLKDNNTVNDNEEKVKSAAEEIYKFLINSDIYRLLISFLNLFIAISPILIIKYKLFYNVYFLCISLFAFVDLLFFLLIWFFIKFNKIDWGFFNIFNLVINIWIINLSLILNLAFNHEQLGGEYIYLIKIWNLICSFKLIICVYLLVSPYVSKKIKIILKGLRLYLFDLFLMIIFIMLIFASLFLNKYGGYVNSSIIDEYNNKIKSNINYGIFNFNDILRSMFTLTIVMFNNNWIKIANLNSFYNKSQENEIKLYFISYLIIIYYLLLSSIIAFIIDNVIMYLDNYKQNRNIKLNQNENNLENNNVLGGINNENDSEEDENNDENENDDEEDHDEDDIDEENLDEYDSEDYSDNSEFVDSEIESKKKLDFLNKK